MRTRDTNKDLLSKLCVVFVFSKFLSICLVIPCLYEIENALLVAGYHVVLYISISNMNCSEGVASGCCKLVERRTISSPAAMDDEILSRVSMCALISACVARRSRIIVSTLSNSFRAYLRAT